MTDRLDVLSRATLAAQSDNEFAQRRTREELVMLPPAETAQADTHDIPGDGLALAYGTLAGLACVVAIAVAKAWGW